MKRTIRLGKTAEGLDVEVTITVATTDGKTRLSMVGDIWNRRRTDTVSYGQMQDHLIADLAKPAYPLKALRRLVEIWDRWHLNDLRAGCEHQRAAQWQTCPGHYVPLDKRTTFWEDGGIFNIERARVELVNCAGVPETMIGEPHLASRFYQGAIHCSLDKIGKPCPTCGYKYGSAWLYEPLPQEIIDELAAWPEKVRK